ncbi:MAG: hypothetical protein PHW50_03365 [Patescibacteria group bacterium]|nr:hypothetical protein [Patescibacteria group bacterium]
MPEIKQPIPINVRFNSPTPKKSKIGLIIFIIVAIFLLSVGVFIYLKFFQKIQNQEGDETKNNVSVEQKFSSRDDINGPYYHSIFTATSEDSLNWTKDRQQIFKHASSPGAVVKNEIIYVYFVDASGSEDQLSVGISYDQGQTFFKKTVTIEGVPKYDVVDPAPVSVDDIIYLYYLGDHMSEANNQERIYTIYQAQSFDGVNFDPPEKVYSDSAQINNPDVFITDKDWRLMVSRGKTFDLAILNDQSNMFKKDISFPWFSGASSCTIENNNEFQTYYHDQGSISVATGAEKGEMEFLKTVLSSNNANQILDFPSVIELQDNSYLMFYTIKEATED